MQLDHNSRIPVRPLGLRLFHIVRNVGGSLQKGFHLAYMVVYMFPRFVVLGARCHGLSLQSLARYPVGGRTERVLLLCRSEEHTSELQSLMRISYAVFCLKKKNIY